MSPSLPAQIDSDFVYDDKERIALGWFSVETKDRQNEIIKVDDLFKVMLKRLSEGIPIADTHSNRIVGKVVNFWLEDHPSGAKGIKGIYKIFSDYPYENKVWQEIKNGKRTGLSIGGLSYANQFEKSEGGELVKVPSNIALFEISSVDTPCNPFALNEGVNMLAKGDNEETTKGDSMSEKDVEKVEDKKDEKKEEKKEVEKKEPEKKEHDKKEDTKHEDKEKKEEGKKEHEKPEEKKKDDATMSGHSTVDEKLDKILALLERSAVHGNMMKSTVEEVKVEIQKEAEPAPVVKAAPVEAEVKKVEPVKEVKPVEKAALESVKTERPMVVDIMKDEEKKDEDMAYKIAKGEKFDLREYERKISDAKEDKIRNFFKR
jgi:outer membrane biosynthesis protein TonB